MDDPDLQRTHVTDYVALREKYLHERETADALLDLAVGSRGWRDCHRRLGDGDALKPFSPVRFRTRVTDVDPLLFDWSWNQLDQTQYLHWSVYHVFAEWLIAPDERGFGGMNVGIQEVPPTGGPLHHGVLDVVFATWDDPRAYCAFPIETESAMLMRFWDHDPDAAAFTLRSVGPVAALLLLWDPAPGGGVDISMIPLTRDPEQQLDDVTFVDGDIATAMPHENEEWSSWGMAIRDLGRRRSFDPTGYTPVWRMTEPGRSASSAAAGPAAFDRFAVDVLSDDELAGLPSSEVRRAHDALWQRYLAAKMLADATLRHTVRTPRDLPTALRELYEDFPVVGRAHALA